MADHHDKESKNTRNLVKLSDLPVYPQKKNIDESLNGDLKRLNEFSRANFANQKEEFDEKVSHYRKLFFSKLSFVSDAFQVSKGYLEHGIDQSKVIYDSLRDEKEQTNKIIAVASGGLVGLIFSYRKGLIKNLFYTSLFSGTVAGFCYPQKTKEYKEVACYIYKNKIPPLVKDYTGVDLNEQVKNFNNSLPDLSFVKNLWNNQTKTANESTDKTTNVEKKD